MKKLLALLFGLVLVFTLSACGPKSTTATGYGLVHGHYVGVVEITVSKDGVVEAMTLDEYFLPYSWAKVAADHADRDDVVAVVGTKRGGDSTNPEDHTSAYYAKYLTIGDKLFTAEVLGAAGSQSINYKATGVTNIEDWVKDNDNAKWYVEQVDAELAFIANADGSANTVLTTLASDASSAGFTKSGTEYWRRDDQLGWPGNVEETIDAIVGMDLSGDFELVSGEGNFWSIDDTVTGATWSDFPDYFNLAVRAYNKAVK
ncbi:MAG: hypothetical protein ACNA7U_02360 [Candidatus Izemoplasmataceae bacterium]